LEPSQPESSEGALVVDNYVSDMVRSIVLRFPDVKQISAITTYRAEGRLYINVHCVLSGNIPISKVHEVMSRIEERVRQRFANAIVTVHPEPVDA
jgi:divalent metal cation (Fe/Co/Zn/Cd) transporter